MRKVRLRRVFISLGIVAVIGTSVLGAGYIGKNKNSYNYVETQAATEAEKIENPLESREEYEAGMDNYDEESGVILKDGIETSGAGEAKVAPENQKIIITWDVSMDTEKYDETIEKIRKNVEKAGGYIESENETAAENCNRYAYLTIRIPSDRVDEWVESAGDLGVIRSKSKGSEDVTLSYVDMESRLKTLRTEQETLLKLLADADKMEDIITLQDKISDINYEIESYESSLRIMSNQVEYSTVMISVQEVSREVATAPSFGLEIKEAFLNSIEGIGLFFRKMTIFLIGNSVEIVMIVGVIVIMKKLLKRRKNKHAAEDDRGPEDH